MDPAEATNTPLASAASSPSDLELIAAIRAGDTNQFETLVVRYQPKIFGMVRRYARREDEVEDIAQEIFVKAFQKLDSFRADAPFEHWITRLAVRTCYDFLRRHQRNREHNVTDLSDAENEADLLDRASIEPKQTDRATATRELIEAVLSQLSPAARMVITLLEIEERSIKEIAQLTGWSQTLVKVRAFRARAEMKKILAKFPVEKYL
ncbi:MAG TPA: sigma-70 family RNA polymerase sigma factor [Verrucomicrobiae bacterium]|nr:sigma-70 family RNA polymerase sigma factor [Verrucomicrobiae bacterium]